MRQLPGLRVLLSVEPTADLEVVVRVPAWDRTRTMVEVVTTAGRAAGVEFRVRLDGVEVWHHNVLHAVFDREALIDWLSAPSPHLGSGDVLLTLDRSVDQDGRIAITLPDVNAWTLSPNEESKLRRRVTSP